AFDLDIADPLACPTVVGLLWKHTHRLPLHLVQTRYTTENAIRARSHHPGISPPISRNMLIEATMPLSVAVIVCSPPNPRYVGPLSPCRRPLEMRTPSGALAPGSLHRSQGRFYRPPCRSGIHHRVT